MRKCDYRRGSKVIANRNENRRSESGNIMQQQLHHWRVLTARMLRQHSVFIGICLTYVVIGYLYISHFGDGQGRQLSYTSYFFMRMLWPIIVMAAGFFVIREAIVERPDRLTKHCWAKIRSQYLTAERLLPALPIIFVLPLVFTTFTNIKVLIPVVAPFSWDPFFADMDRIMHFGRQPWEWLHPLLGTPSVTKLVYVTYIVWLLYMYTVLFWQAFSLSDPFLRMRYFLTFTLSWMLIGSVGGTLLSSAGPVYFERVTGSPGDFGALMDYLQMVYEGADGGLIAVQEYLWEGYLATEGRRFGGISAMPSMHIAMVTVIALLGWSHSRLLGMLFTFFAIVILIGSVHLAWHYAVDGYAAALAVCVLWAIVGAVLRRLAPLLGISERAADDRKQLSEARVVASTGAE